MADPVVIHSRADDGTITEHRFVALRLSKRRLKALRAHLAPTVSKGDDLTDMEKLNAAAAALDHVLRDPIGEVTIASLWEDGSLTLDHLGALTQRFFGGSQMGR